jgi:hypothetical protein
MDFPPTSGRAAAVDDRFKIRARRSDYPALPGAETREFQALLGKTTVFTARDLVGQCRPGDETAAMCLALA